MGSRRSIVVVREQIEDREIVNWAPLQGRYDVSLVGGPVRGPYSGDGAGLPVQRVGSLATLLGAGPVQRAIARRADRRFDTERLLRLQRSIRGADIVVVNETHLTSSAQAAVLRKGGGPAVATVCYENIPFRYEESLRLARRKDLVRAHTSLFIAMTPEAAHALRLEGVESERIVVQPYGVEVDRFTSVTRSPSLRDEMGLADDDIAVLFAGRLLQEKGLVPLLVAIHRLADPRVVPVIVGGGPELLRLKRAALGLRLRLIHRPWLESREIPPMMAACDIFAIPSLPTPYWEEQLGFSAIEAMAARLPILTTASGSLPFVVGGGGVCVPPYDVAALAQALGELAGSPDRRRALGDAGHARVESDLNTTVVAKRLSSLIDGVLSDRCRVPTRRPEPSLR